MVHDLVPYLLAVLYIYTSVLEDTVLHLDVVEQTVFWVKAMEQSVLVDKWLPLAWDISVVLRAGACSRQSNDTLARFDQVHAARYLTFSSKEFTVPKGDKSHVKRDRDQDFVFEVSEDLEALQELKPLVKFIRDEVRGRTGNAFLRGSDRLDARQLIF